MVPALTRQLRSMLFTRTEPRFVLPSARQARPLAHRWRTPAWSSLGVFAVYLALVFATQLVVGAYSAEPAHYADEPAHFLNGLLVRDYLTTGLGTNPLTFAERYYLDYPKIAPGVWGPVFHILLGLFLLPGWPPHAGALVLVGLITALTAWRLDRMVSLFATPIAAFFTAIIYLLVPLTVDLSSVVMLDIVVAAFCVEATYRLAIFASTERTRDGALFGVFATLCCLTKGNGVAIIFVPALLILLTGRYRLLACRGLYVAAGVVLALAAPLLAISYRFDAAMGDFTGTGVAATASRLAFCLRFLWDQLKPPFFLVSLIGAWEAIRLGRRVPSPGEVPVAPALVALAAAGLLFHVLLPLSGLDGRYIAMSLAALVGLVPLGIMRVTTGIASAPPRRAVQALICGTLLFTVATIEPVVAARRSLGYQELVEFMNRQGELANRRIVVISDVHGEGAFVTEVAKRGPQPAPTVIRGSKLFVESDWMGEKLKFLFSSPQAVMDELEALHVDFVVFDSAPAVSSVPFWSLAKSVVDEHGAALKSVYVTHVDRLRGPLRPLTLYRLTERAAGPPKKFRMNLQYSLGKVLER